MMMPICIDFTKILSKELIYVINISIQLVAGILVIRNIFIKEESIVKNYFFDRCIEIKSNEDLIYYKGAIKEKFIEVYVNEVALVLFIITVLFGNKVESVDMNGKVVIGVVLFSLVLFIIVSILYANQRAKKAVEKIVSIENLKKLGIKPQICMSSLDKEKIEDAKEIKPLENVSCSGDVYLMKLNRALYLYNKIENRKEITYPSRNIICSFENWILKQNSFIINIIIFFMLYILTIVFYSLLYKNGEDFYKVIEFFFFPVLVIVFCNIVRLDGDDKLKIEEYKKELYEISLDIYDQLCLEQDVDQDKRELKGYIERNFLNKV